MTIDFKEERKDHLVVIDLWKCRDELDTLIEQLDKAVWQHKGDGASPPCHMLGDDEAGAFVMILDGRTSLVWRLEAHPNTHMIRPVTDCPVLTDLETTKSNARAAVRKSLVASREAFNSIANWIQLNDLAKAYPDRETQSEAKKHPLAIESMEQLDSAVKSVRQGLSAAFEGKTDEQ